MLVLVANELPTPNTNRCLFMLCVGMGGHGCAHVMQWVGMGGHRSCMSGHGCNLKGKFGPLIRSKELDVSQNKI